MNETQKLVSEFHRNSIELVKVYLREWKSKLYADVRIWVLGDPAKPGGAVAKKKGIRLSVDLLPKLIEGLNETSRIHKKEEGKRDEENEQASIKVPDHL